MLTVRGSFLICPAVFGLAAGVLMEIELLVVLCLAILCLVWLQYLLFQWRRRAVKQFCDSFQRTIHRQNQATISLVAERPYDVRLTFDLGLLQSGVRISLQDAVPDGFSIQGLSYTVFETGFQRLFDLGESEFHQPGALEYQISTPVSGQFQFAGVKLELSDGLGFFRRQIFVPLSQNVTSLPFMLRPQTTVSVLKHNNLQQHLGHHRHRSAGISSELHGIRDYRPGDPPRSIAWKATGKLGRLMTSEYENEVPIRATMLVDLAAYQFENRPAVSAGDRAISSAASIARLLLSDRDPVAAILINDLRTTVVKHGNGERQLAKLLRFLLEMSDAGTPLNQFPFRDLIHVVFEHATIRFGDLMDEKYNYGRLPFRFTGMFSTETDYFRRPLAVLFEHLFCLPFGSASRMMYSNSLIYEMCLRYVRQYSIDSASTSLAIDPPYRDIGSWLDVRNRVWLELFERLNQLRARAKEKELFVIIAPEPHDLLSCDMMESAIKNAVAARHRVIFVAPEAPMYPKHVSDPLAAEIFERHHRPHNRSANSELGGRLQELGVAFARIDDPQVMAMVAAEIGVLKSGARQSAARGITRRG